MQRLAHVSLIALASMALPSQADVFYDAAGRIDYITNVSVTASRFEWDSSGAPPLPEPGTWALMLSGLAAVGWRARRKR